MVLWAKVLGPFLYWILHKVLYITAGKSFCKYWMFPMALWIEMDTFKIVSIHSNKAGQVEIVKGGYRGIS